MGKHGEIHSQSEAYNADWLGGTEYGRKCAEVEEWKREGKANFSFLEA